MTTIASSEGAIAFGEFGNPPDATPQANPDVSDSEEYSLVQYKGRVKYETPEVEDTGPLYPLPPKVFEGWLEHTR